MKYPATILLMVCLICCYPTAIAQKSLPAEKMIRQLEEQRRQASISNDTTILSGLFAPEFYEIGRQGKYRAKAQNMRTFSVPNATGTQCSVGSFWSLSVLA